MLTSLAGQTLTDFEVIAVDDGSTDTTLAKLETWSERDSRFRILAQPHGGVIAAANAGLSVCTAPYIARMDADDRADPERLARQAAYLADHPEVAVVSSLVKAFPDRRCARRLSNLYPVAQLVGDRRRYPPGDVHRKPVSQSQYYDATGLV